MALKIVGVQALEGGSVTLQPDGSLKIQPVANYDGQIRFKYLVEDALGAQSIAEASYDLIPVNDAPLVADESSAGAEDTTLVFSVAHLLANDVDIEGDSLSITGIVTSNYGTAMFDAASQTISFSPFKDYSGPANFTYTVSDGKGGTANATMHLTINPVNDAPVAVGELLGGVEDTQFKVAIASLLANDSDVDGDSLSIFGVSGGPGVQSVWIDGGYIYMNPQPNFYGNASFNYTISDGKGGLAAATAVVAVQDVSDAPSVPANIQLVLGNGEPFQISALASDPNGLGMSYSLESVSYHGSSTSTRFQPSLGIWGGTMMFGFRTHMAVGGGAGEGQDWDDVFFNGYASATIRVQNTNGESSYINAVIYTGDPYWGIVGTPPLIFDLNGDGEVLSNSGILFDWTGDGKAAQSDWISAQDAYLALDRNSNGLIDAEDIQFTKDHPDALTDLDGIRLAYDTNQDGKFDQLDEKFADFRLWQDSNQDGISQIEEIRTLAEHGITGIGLGVERHDVEVGNSIIHRWVEVYKADGTILQAADVSLGHADVPSVPASPQQLAASLIAAASLPAEETVPDPEAVACSLEISALTLVPTEEDYRFAS
jgi:hypothetical protein